MLLKEFFDNSVYDPSSDQQTARELSDTRKSIVTLRDLNKLKKVRAFKRLKELQRADLISVMYGSNNDDGSF